MTEDLNLPASVQGRKCFQQLIGAWAVDSRFLDGAVSFVRDIGLPSIWKANESRGEYPEFSPAINSLADSLREAGITVEAKSGDGMPDGSPPPYINVDGTAIIPIAGPISKHSHSLSHEFGGSSTVGMRKAISMAERDNSVKRVLFHIDSPGGTVAGTGDLGDDISAMSKPTASYIEDLGASAAYWLASQTGHIYASPHAEIGSIGVIMVVQDTSKMAADAGIKVHVIKSGPYKGGPVPGAPVTDAQLGKMQSSIDSLHDRFVSVVAAGRSLPKESVAKLADGSLYFAHSAKKSGLIDSVSSLRDSMRVFSATTTPGNERKKMPAAPQYQLTTTGTNANAGTIVMAGTSLDAMAVPVDITWTMAPEMKVPSNPANGGGDGVDGAWSKPSLSDFTDKQWSGMSSGEKGDVAHYYADAADSWTDNFDADLNLPHHFSQGGSKGKASLNGTRNALARLSQVKNLHSSADAVRSHLQAHLPAKEASAWAEHAAGKRTMLSICREFGFCPSNLIDLD